MRRCTSCFRFHPGSPTYCSYCGRSFDVRICSRGHRNPRGVRFCSECGSSELSTPAPPATLLFQLSGIALYGFALLAIGIVLLAAVLALLRTIDLRALTPSLLGLVLMLALLYWTTTLLPGPVKRIGKAAGRRLFGSGSKHNRKT